MRGVGVELDAHPALRRLLVVGVYRRPADRRSPDRLTGRRVVGDSSLRLQCISRMNPTNPAGNRRREPPTISPGRLAQSPFEDWEWQLSARCRGHPAHLFFPEGLRGLALIRLEAEAKRICSDCPVVSECRDHAVRTPELWGVWGAMTSRERARLYPSPTTR